MKKDDKNTKRKNIIKELLTIVILLFVVLTFFAWIKENYDLFYNMFIISVVAVIIFKMKYPDEEIKFSFSSTISIFLISVFIVAMIFLFICKSIFLELI